MATVWIPPLMRAMTSGAERVTVTGATVREVVAELDERFPGMAERLVDGNRIRPGLAVAINGVMSHHGLREKVAPDSEVHFVPAIAGGQGG